MKKESDDVFKEASMLAASKALEKATTQLQSQGLDKEKVVPQIKQRLEEGETQWDVLKRMIDGELTERFLTVLQNMPDRDFARNYLKLVEHFKPKMTRMEVQSAQEENRDINIRMTVLNKNNEPEVIDITHTEHDEEEKDL